MTSCANSLHPQLLQEPSTSLLELVLLTLTKKMSLWSSCLGWGSRTPMIRPRHLLLLLGCLLQPVLTPVNGPLTPHQVFINVASILRGSPELIRIVQPCSSLSVLKTARMRSLNNGSLFRIKHAESLARVKLCLNA